MNTPVSVSKPVAPVNIPVPVKIVLVACSVTSIATGSGVKTMASVPLNVSAPPCSENVNVPVSEAGVKKPGPGENVNEATSESFRTPNGVEEPEPVKASGTVGIVTVGGAPNVEFPFIVNVKLIVPAHSAFADA